MISGSRVPRPRAVDLGLPDIVVETLREHPKAELELRVAFGLGNLDPGPLVYPATHTWRVAGCGMKRRIRPPVQQHAARGIKQSFSNVVVSLLNALA